MCNDSPHLGVTTVLNAKAFPGQAMMAHNGCEQTISNEEVVVVIMRDKVCRMLSMILISYSSARTHA
jgi:hypothetical protein